MLVYSEWAQEERLPALRARYDAHNHVELGWHDGGSRVERQRHIWFADEDRLRVELRDDDGLTREAVRRGVQWAWWDREQGVAQGSLSSREAVDAAPPLLYPMNLEPLGLLAQLILLDAGFGTRAGRAVACATARPRRHLPFVDNITHELEFDAAYGVVLRSATLIRGRHVAVSEAVHVDYDATIDDGKFVLGMDGGDTLSQ